jgi:hypothetical protein
MYIQFQLLIKLAERRRETQRDAFVKCCAQM